jgi:hypothetical protein
MTAYLCQSEIYQGSRPCYRIKQKVSGLQISVYDPSSMNVTKCSKQATKVLANSQYVEVSDKFLYSVSIERLRSSTNKPLALHSFGRA